MKNGVAFYFVFIVVLSLQFFYFIKGNNITDYMDFSGWLFYVASCLSHAASVGLFPLLTFLVLRIFRMKKMAVGIFVILSTLFSIMVYLDMMVYQLYRFHINGIVLSMFFGKGGREIFNFSR